MGESLKAIWRVEMFKSTKLDSLAYVNFESLTTNDSKPEMCRSPKARLMSCPRMTENANHESSPASRETSKIPRARQILKTVPWREN